MSAQRDVNKAIRLRLKLWPKSRSQKVKAESKVLALKPIPKLWFLDQSGLETLTSLTLSHCLGAHV